MGFFSRTKIDPTSDVLELLKDEHRDVRQLFDDIQGRAQDEELSPDDMLAIYCELRSQLIAHSRAEDRVVYDEFEAYDTLAERVRESREEHALVEHIFDDMDLLDVADEIWLAKLKVLRDLVEHHVEEEEGDRFPAAKKVIGPDRRKELAQAFLAAKAQELRILDGDAEPDAASGASMDEVSEGEIIQ